MVFLYIISCYLLIHSLAATLITLQTKEPITINLYMNVKVATLPRE